jgi:hypothetical protein
MFFLFFNTNTDCKNVDGRKIVFFENTDARAHHSSVLPNTKHNRRQLTIVKKMNRSSIESFDDTEMCNLIYMVTTFNRVIGKFEVNSTIRLRSPNIKMCGSVSEIWKCLRLHTEYLKRFHLFAHLFNPQHFEMFLSDIEMYNLFVQTEQRVRLLLHSA